jgi:heptosyltransferase III
MMRRPAAPGPPSAEPPEEAPQRILVLCRPILGDMILAGPVFRNLRAWRPDARIVAACLEGTRDLLSFVAEADEVVEIPNPRRVGRRLGFAARWLALARRLRAERFDLVYDMQQTDRSSLLVAAIGAARRTGFVRGERRIRHRLYTHTTPWRDGDGERAHALELYLDPLAAVGMPVRTRSISLSLRPEDAAAARARLRAVLPRREGPLVVCHPGASSPNKCWPIEEFAAACDELQGRLEAQVLLLGGPAEGEALRTLRSLTSTRPALLEGVLPLRVLAAVLAEADLFFGHDSGPMHVAAAVGTPVVALYGASSPAQWRPLGEGHALLRPPMPCVPCRFPALCRPPSPYDTFCVRRIPGQAVVEALARQLARPAGGGAPP